MLIQVGAAETHLDETQGEDSVIVDLPERVGYTVMFLRMAAAEARKLAEHTPEIARELGHIAEQAQVEADSLAGYTISE